MKIVRVADTTRVWTFFNLAVGDVFMGQGGDIYMKVREFKTTGLINRWNAINLTINEPHSFSDDAEVACVYPEAHLVLGRPS